MFALALFGIVLEGLIGGKKFLLVFFASGIVANIVSIFFYSSSLGASGAIYGIIGTLMIVRPFMVAWGFGLPMPMFVAGIVWAAGDLVGLFVPSDIGHIAHLSGIVMGILLGLFYRDWTSRTRNRDLYFDERTIRNWEDTYLK